MALAFDYPHSHQVVQPDAEPRECYRCCSARLPLRRRPDRIPLCPPCSAVIEAEREHWAGVAEEQRIVAARRRAA
jgi:hypothetical protein